MKTAITFATMLVAILTLNIANAQSIGRLSVTPVLGPSMWSPSWNSFATKLVTDAKNRTLNMVPAVSVTDPTMYTVLPSGKVSWYNFVYSTQTGMWAGDFPIGAPFDVERGQVVIGLSQAESVSGGNDISLSMISVTSGSSDPGNTLGDTLSFELGLDYTPLAIGIKADGSLVTSGSSTEKVARVIFLTQMKMFDGGDSLTGLNAVKNWIGLQGNFRVTYTIQFAGIPESKVSTAVSLSGFSNQRPTVTITPDGVTIKNGEIGRSYMIQSAPSVTGPWQAIGTVSSGGTIAIKRDVAMQFYRAYSP